MLFALLAIPDHKDSIHVLEKNKTLFSSKWWGKFAQNLVKYRITSKQNQAFQYNKHQLLLHKHLDILLLELTEPNAPILDSINYHINKLSALVSLSPGKIPQFKNDVALWRKLLKYQSRYWNTSSEYANNRLFEFIMEGRLAFESALIQSNIEKAQWHKVKDSTITKSFNFDNLSFQSGDIIAFSLNPSDNNYSSVFKELPNVYQHLGSIIIKNEKAFVIYLDRLNGLTKLDVKNFKEVVAPNGIILRLREDIPPLLRNPELPTLAASTMWKMAESGQYKYDYNYNGDSHSYVYDWEFISMAFAKHGLNLNKNVWNRGNLSIEIGTHKKHLLPFEVELDPRFIIVGEWYNSNLLYENRLLAAATYAIMKYNSSSNFISYLSLPFYRLLKAYSMLIGVFGFNQPIPSGISAQTHLVYNSLVKQQQKTVEALRLALQSYEKKHRHKATYLKMLQKADEIMFAEIND